MTRHACARCERPMRDQATICHACTADLKKTLATIADLWEALQQAIGKQTRMGTRTDHKPTKTDAQPMPVNLTASDVADAARATITGWVRVLAEDNQLPRPADTIPAMCAWLGDHTRQLRMHEAAADIADELTWTAGRISKAVDYPDDRSRVLVGACPETLDDEPCPGLVYAIIPERDGGSPRMECRPNPKQPATACCGEWDTTQWNRMGHRIKQRERKIDMQRSYGKATA